MANYSNPRPQIDGVVDDCWQRAYENNGFIQRAPEQGKPATADTKFYILYDKQNIYLLFVMLDPHPDKIPARLVERDYRFYPDDSINFFLDTFNDNQRAFYFSTNPYGVEQDGLISDNGSRIDMNWDGIFEVAAKKTDVGWVAEFAIPYSTLRFDGSRSSQVWGFNTWRIRKEHREISYWELVDQNYNMFRLDIAGEIVGAKNIKQGMHLQFLPYFTSQSERPGGRYSDLTNKVGFDARLGVTPDATLNLTVNPDFGQVEIDEEQINLDKRFELFLPEKRPFFLENTNLFQLPISTFYSRRIGTNIENRLDTVQTDNGPSVVPREFNSEMTGGVKLTGKTGPYSFGYIGSKTGDWKNFGLGDPDVLPSDQFFNIARIQRDVLKNSNIGLMFTDLEENPGSNTGSGYNRSLSMDWNLYKGREYFVGQLVYSSADLPRLADEGNGSAGRATLSHYDQKYWIFVDGFFYDKDFEVNGTGFFPKIPGKGRKDFGFYVDTHPFLNGRILRSWGISSYQRIFRDSDEEQNGLGIQNKLWFELVDQSRLTFTMNHYREVETDILNVNSADEFSYNGRDLELSVSTDRGKIISAIVSYNYVKQYYFQLHATGFSQGFNASFYIKPVSNGFFELGYQNRQFLDKDKNFIPSSKIGQNDVRLFFLRGRYLFTKNIFSRTFVQFTNGAEFIKQFNF
ncbi:MAG: DUF5916 domain-containing protein, partial [Calditrichia bacterium]